MPRFPKPWSKKRGERFAGIALRGVAGEAAFYTGLFLFGVFGISLVLISRFAPEKTPDVSPEALAGGLATWIFGILSLAAIGSGAGGLIFRLMTLGASSERRSALKTRASAIEIGAAEKDSRRLPNVPRGRSMTDSPGERLTYRLPAETVQSAELAGPATLALLWNSVWFVLLAVVIAGFWFGRPRWILAGLLIPFAGIGWWSFRFFLLQLKQHAGVGQTIVEISDHPLVPGRQYQLYVSQSGRLRLKRILVKLTCEEETFYRQGTDVRVERYEAFTQQLHLQSGARVDPQAPWEQQLTLDLPENVMHSFVGTHNAIRWKIVVSGESPVAIVLPKFSRRRPSAGIAAETQPAVSLTLDHDDGIYRAGGTLTASWRVSRVTLDRLEAIEVSVMWHTEGKGDEDLHVHSFQRWDENHIRRMGLADEQPLHCDLPVTPLSYHGRLISVRWCIRLRLFMSDGREIVTEHPFHLVSTGADHKQIVSEPGKESRQTTAEASASALY